VTQDAFNAGYLMLTDYHPDRCRHGVSLGYDCPRCDDSDDFLTPFPDEEEFWPYDFDGDTSGDVKMCRHYVPVVDYCLECEREDEQRMIDAMFDPWLISGTLEKMNT
jgi:hypothetical protein